MPSTRSGRLGPRRSTLVACSETPAGRRPPISGSATVLLEGRMRPSFARQP